MSHFAKIDINNMVTKVIVAEQEFIDDSVVGDSSLWIQTSYNTRGGIHSNGETPLRFNFAGIGYTYDPTRDAFIAPQPFPSWALNEDTCLWESPVAYPDDDKMYTWDEATTNWIEVTGENV